MQDVHGSAVCVLGRIVQIVSAICVVSAIEHSRQSGGQITVEIDDLKTNCRVTGIVTVRSQTDKGSSVIEVGVGNCQFAVKSANELEKLYIFRNPSTLADCFRSAKAA